MIEAHQIISSSRVPAFAKPRREGKGSLPKVSQGVGSPGQAE